MHPSASGVRVVRDGAVTRVFVYVARTPRRLLATATCVILGVLLMLVGGGIVTTVFRTSGILSFDGLGLIIAGIALEFAAYGIAPIPGRWCCQLIYDGEAVYSLGGGTGLREPLDSLRVVGRGEYRTIYGAHGRLSPSLLQKDAEAAVSELRASARTSRSPEHHLSRIVAPSRRAADGGSTSVLPRPGVRGVDAGRRVFWPLVALMFALPSLLVISSLSRGASTGWDEIALMLLGIATLGYTMTAAYLIYGLRQRARLSAPMLPQTVTYSDESVRVTDSAPGRWSHTVIEVPFSELHNVDLLDPNDDAVSRIGRENGIPASGLVLVHGSRQALREGRSETRTVVLRGIPRTDALQIREAMLYKRDEWRHVQATVGLAPGE